MRDLALQKTVLTLITLLLAVPLTMAQPAASKSSGKAIVIDERLSALREDADTQAQVVRRLQLGQPVTILGMKGGKDGQRFYRVAVTSRTRGWVHELAVALPGRAGEDERVMKLIEAMDEGVERLELCRIFLEHFSRSPLAPRVLMAMG
ncbi:MAG TPA: SH3 domain-containing protein, partial [Blastocatellia bacterium]|nr:SH3 domain-containing protein [Blastocatellia bacterium]